jgi:hypothetical protein
MSEIAPFNGNLDRIYGEIRQILAPARLRAWQAINTAMVTAYWEIGRVIVQEEQRGAARAEYEAEAVSARWSTRELACQINSLLFERLALSRDKDGAMALAQKGHEIREPADEELTREVQRERHQVELERQLAEGASQGKPDPRPAPEDS